MSWWLCVRERERESFRNCYDWHHICRFTPHWDRYIQSLAFWWFFHGRHIEQASQSEAYHPCPKQLVDCSLYWLPTPNDRWLDWPLGSKLPLLYIFWTPTHFFSCNSCGISAVSCLPLDTAAHTILKSTQISLSKVNI